MPILKKIDQIKADAKKAQSNDDSIVKVICKANRWKASQLLYEIGAADLMADAELAGRVEFGLKPHLSEFLAVFDRYVSGWCPVVRQNEIYVLSPTLTLSLLMKAILIDLDKIDSKCYSVIGRLPWDQDINYIEHNTLVFLSEFCHSTAGTDVFLHLSNEAIPNSLIGTLLHSSIAMSRQPVGRNLISVKQIDDWCLSETAFVYEAS